MTEAQENLTEAIEETEAAEATFTLPRYLWVDIKLLGVQKVDLLDKDIPWILWGLGLGLKQSAGDANAGHASDSDQGVGKIQAKWDKINAGEIPAGSGRGSAGPRTRADRDWMVENGFKKLKLDDVELTWPKIVQAILVANGTDEAEITEDVIDARLEEVQALVRGTDTWRVAHTKHAAPKKKKAKTTNGIAALAGQLAALGPLGADDTDSL